MTKRDLEIRILRFLENSVLQPSINYKKIGLQPAYLFDSFLRKRGKFIEVYIEENPEYFEFIHEQSIYLKKLYDSLTISEKLLFEKIILKYILPKNNPQYARTAFKVIVHINLFNKAFRIIENNFKTDEDKVYIEIIKTLSEILRYEWTIFSSEQIEGINNWLDKVHRGINHLGRNRKKHSELYIEVNNILNRLYRQINILIVKKYKKDIISRVNKEIEQDKKVVIEKINKYGLPNDLEEALIEIEEKIDTADNGFDYQGCMSLLRSFSERLYKSIAEKINPMEGKKMDEKDSEKVAKYFQEEGLISGDHGKLLVALRHFLSNKGTHRLKSYPEDARLSKNMMIEFSLYLLHRLDGLKKA